MNKKKKKDNTVIMSDKYLSESGVQGGKVIADHIALGSFIFGISFLAIGIISIIAMIFNFGIPTHAAAIIGVLIITIIGLLLVIGGYNIHRTKNTSK
jgi:tetrahydromethanopterin S-methyltransferase subunit C